MNSVASALSIAQEPEDFATICLSIYLSFNKVIPNNKSGAYSVYEEEIDHRQAQFQGADGILARHEGADADADSAIYLKLGCGRTYKYSMPVPESIQAGGFREFFLGEGGDVVL